MSRNTWSCRLPVCLGDRQASCQSLTNQPPRTKQTLPLSAFSSRRGDDRRDAERVERPSLAVAAWTFGFPVTKAESFRDQKKPPATTPRGEFSILEILGCGPDARCDPRPDDARSVEVGQGTPARRRSDPADTCVMQDGGVVGADRAERRAVL